MNARDKFETASPFEAVRPFILKLPLYLAPLFPLAFLAGNVVTEMTVLFTVICFAIHLHLTRDFSFTREKWLQVASVFILYLLARNIILEHPGKAISLILHTVEFILFALALAYWVLTTDKAHKRLLVSLGAVLIFTIADSFYQFSSADGKDLFGWSTDMANRLTGPFEYKRVGAFISYLMFPVLCVGLDRLWSKYPHFWAHIVGLLIIATFLFILLLSGERVTLIYFVVGYGIMISLWKRHHIPMLRMTLLVVTTVLVLLVSFLFIEEAAPHHLQPIKESYIYKSLRSRIFVNSVEIAKAGSQNHYSQIWSRAYTMFTYAPIFGVGVHQFMLRCPDSVYGPTDNIHDRCAIHIHHYYLEFLTETGLVGFSLIVTVFLLLLAKIWATRHRWDEVPLLLGLFAAYFISIWPLAPFRGFFQSWRAMMFWFIVGWMLAAINTYAKSSRNSYPEQDSASRT